MAETLTAEKLAQRALDVNILTEDDLNGVWSEYGTRNVDLDPFKQSLVRRGLLTNYQLDRLVEGYKTGFFFGEYKVQYCVGAGTFARVFRAAHRKTGDLFAIKVLRSRYSRDPAQAEMFRREGELGAELKHPNIVGIHEVISKGAVHFIVMDFVEGQNLRDFYKVRGRFEPLEATRIAADMMAGLNYAFLKGVSHRDLKMSNVIISSDGDAKLLDFGLAGLGGADAVDTDTANPRTIDYAGLERSSNVRKDDIRSDIFFSGCIYYQLMSGRAALAETRERSQRLSKSRYTDIKPILEVLPSIPLGLARIVTKAIEFDPARRYQTPGEMLADLKVAAKRVAEARDDPSLLEEQALLEGQYDDGQPRKLMIVESDHKMQDVFRELFKKVGYRVLVTSDPERLIQRIQDDPRVADALLISAGQLGRDALEVFNKLGQDKRTSQLPVVLLLGESQAAWMKEAAGGPKRLVTKMPLKSRELRHAILASLAAT